MLPADELTTIPSDRITASQTSQLISLKQLMQPWELLTQIARCKWQSRIRSAFDTAPADSAFIAVSAVMFVTLAKISGGGPWYL